MVRGLLVEGFRTIIVMNTLGIQDTNRHFGQRGRGDTVERWAEAFMAWSR
jgi:hypothetical protein